MRRSPASRPISPGDPCDPAFWKKETRRGAFETFANDEPCPVLDPATGACDLYAARPMTCRIFDLRCNQKMDWESVNFAITALPTSRLVACEMKIDPERAWRMSYWRIL